MGWCGGTEVFDDVMDAVIEYVPDEDTRRSIAVKVAEALWAGDWDCEADSLYYEEYLVPIMLDKGFIDADDI